MNKIITYATQFLSPDNLDSGHFSWKKSIGLGFFLILLNLVLSCIASKFSPDHHQFSEYRNIYFRIFWIIFISPFVETIIILIIYVMIRKIFSAWQFGIVCGVITGGVMHYPWGFSTPYQVISFIAFSYMFYKWKIENGWKLPILMVTTAHLVANIPPSIEKLLTTLQ